MKVAVGLTFPGKLQDEGIICYVCKNFEINLNIIEASFSMNKGWSILTLEGQDDELKRVFEYLSSKDIHIENIETNK
jgi:ABC-type methionine transport system ATPase subunit